MSIAGSKVKPRWGPAIPKRSARVRFNRPNPLPCPQGLTGQKSRCLAPNSCNLIRALRNDKQNLLIACRAFSLLRNVQTCRPHRVFSDFSFVVGHFPTNSSCIGSLMLVWLGIFWLLYTCVKRFLAKQHPEDKCAVAERCGNLQDSAAQNPAGHHTHTHLCEFSFQTPKVAQVHRSFVRVSFCVLTFYSHVSSQIFFKDKKFLQKIVKFCHALCKPCFGDVDFSCHDRHINSKTFLVIKSTKNVNQNPQECGGPQGSAVSGILHVLQYFTCELVPNTLMYMFRFKAFGKLLSVLPSGGKKLYIAQKSSPD